MVTNPAPKEPVVLTGTNYHSEDLIISVYTHNNLYIAPLASCYPVPTFAELTDRMYHLLAFMQVSSQNVSGGLCVLWVARKT